MADAPFVPDNFKNMCSVAGMDEKAVETAWVDVTQRAIVDLLTWLLTGPLLSDEQKSKLGKFVSYYGEKEGNVEMGDGGIWAVLRPYMSASQEEEAKKKGEEFLKNNLTKFFTDLKSKMTYEENQVFRGVASNS